MDKRLLNFILVSMLLFIVYMELLKRTQPKPAGNLNAIVENPAVKEENPVPLVADNDQASTAQANQVVEAESLLLEEEDFVRTPVELKRFTIGSVDPASGYSMLITFINRGGAVERVELSDSRYRDLTEKTAYIGHLAYSTADNGGVVINVVGAGTPVAVAGIRVGDVITKIGGQAVNTPKGALLATQKFKYGDAVPITLSRNGKVQSLNVKSVRRPLEVIRAEAAQTGEQNLRHQLSYLLTLHQIGVRSVQFDQDELANIPSLRNENWQTTVSEQEGVTNVEFRFPLGPSELKKLGVEGSIEIVKRFSLTAAAERKPERNYHFDFDVELVNRGTNDIHIGYRIDGATGLPLEGWWYSYKTRPGFWAWGAAGVRDIVWRPHLGNHGMFANAQINGQVIKYAEGDAASPYMLIADQQSEFNLQYLGTDAQYFNSSLLASARPDAQPCLMERVDARAVSEIDTKRKNRTDVTFRVDSVPISVAAGQSTKYQFEIFAGPKHTDVLNDYGLQECIVYGWFKWPAQVMGVLLHGLHAVVGNYGIAIILLTVIVRACMFPIGRRMAMNAKKMQELSPEIKKIKEKYPKDTEKQAKAQQELFRKHKYNPLAGCLPMFVQIPIFIGLYRALSVDIELRQTPLIPGLDWCSNLAGPDMFFQWDTLIPFPALTGYTGWLGPFFNILPIISACVFIFHQKIFTPPPTDEQQEMQQKIMMFMPVMMCVLFFRMPAGLNLYFITSSLWALGERLMLPKDNKKTEQTPVSLSAKSDSAIEISADSPAQRSNGQAAARVVAKKKRRKRKKK